MRTLNNSEINIIAGGLNLDNVNKPIAEFTFSQFLEAFADLAASAATDPNAVMAAYPWMNTYSALLDEMDEF